MHAGASGMQEDHAQMSLALSMDDIPTAHLQESSAYKNHHSSRALNDFAPIFMT